MESNVESHKRVFESRWLNVFEAHANIKGHPCNWTFCTRKKEVYTKDKEPDAIMVVPLVREKGETRILLIREFRVPVGDYEYSFPAGLMDSGENMESCADRELLEETGYGIDRILIRSPRRLYTSAGLSDETVQTVIVAASFKRDSAREASEDIEVLLLNHKQMCALINQELLMNARAWPICLMYQQMGHFPEICPA